MLAYKELDEAYFEEWKQRHHEASVSLVDRDDKLDALFEEIERDLVLIGETGRVRCERGEIGEIVRQPAVDGDARHDG